MPKWAGSDLNTRLSPCKSDVLTELDDRPKRVSIVTSNKRWNLMELPVGAVWKVQITIFRFIHCGIRTRTDRKPL